MKERQREKEKKERETTGEMKSYSVAKWSIKCNILKKYISHCVTNPRW